MAMPHNKGGAATPGKGNGSKKINRAAASEPMIVRPAGRCDFCGDRHPAWHYPCREFVRGVVPGSRRLVLHMMGPWAACASCRRLIDADEWGRLLRRVTRLYRAANPGLSPAAALAIEAELPALWLQFQAHRTGPAESTEEAV